MRNRPVTPLPPRRGPRLVPDASAPDEDDGALVRALQRGEVHAAGALWDRHAGLVRGLLVRTLGPGAEVDDLVQDVFLKLLEALPGLRDPSALRGYAAITALSAARSELRRRRVRRLVWFASRTPPPEPEALPADLATAEALRRLHGALDRLKPDDRLVFCLRYMELMELTEVATVMGISLATTKRNLARAKRRLWVLAERDPILAPYLVDGGEQAREGET